MIDPADANDADILRFAASHARHLAGEPTAWGGDARRGITPGVYTQDGEARMVVPTRRNADLLHISTWDPQLAHLVADWLDQHAHAHQPAEDWIDDPYECWLDESACPALAVARTVLGEDR